MTELPKYSIATLINIKLGGADLVRLSELKMNRLLAAILLAISSWSNCVSGEVVCELN